jgi:hypothetical protein
MVHQTVGRNFPQEGRTYSKAGGDRGVLNYHLKYVCIYTQGVGVAQSV